MKLRDLELLGLVGREILSLILFRFVVFVGSRGFETELDNFFEVKWCRRISFGRIVFLMNWLYL